MKLNIRISKKLILVSIIVLAGVSLFQFRTVHVPDLGASIATPIATINPQIKADGHVVDLSYTDDTKQESLIIRSDKSDYTGDLDSDVYFSVTNTSKIDESAILLFYFPGQFIPNRSDPPGTGPATVTYLEQRIEDTWQKREFFAKNIKIDENALSQAITKRKPIPEDFEVKVGTQIEVSAGQTVYFKSKISFRSTDSGEFWIEALGKNGGYGLLDPTYTGTRYGSKASSDTAASWYTSGSNTWTYRKKISIDFRKVSGAQSSFPVLLSFTDTNLRKTTFGGNAASGSGEFIVTSSNGTTSLPYEIETYSSSSGQFIGWVNVTTLSATQDTVLYMYYGGPAAGGATNQNKTGTWNSAYVGVWHLPNGTTLTAKDSTSNANNGSVSGGPTATTGQIDGGYGSVGGDEIINAGSASSLDDLSTLTFSAWIKPTSMGEGSGGVIMGKANGTGDLRWSFTGTNALNFAKDYNTTDLARTMSNNSITLSTWSYVVVTWDGSATAANVKQYVNGIETSYQTTTDGSSAKNSDAALNFNIGNVSGLFHSWNGTIDEARASNVARSAGWIATEYNNQNSPSTFYSLGAQEKNIGTPPGLKYGSKASSDTAASWYTSGSSTWTYRKKISIDYRKVSGAQSNFPVLVSFTDTNLRKTTFGGNAASGSGEFIVTSSDGTTSLPYEIETYSSSSGQFIGWVNVTTLSATNNTNLYLYYGGPAAGGATNQNKTGTWNSAYKDIWHLPNGTTLTAKDSTSNANNGTLVNAPTATTGQIDGGANFNGSSQYITAGNPNHGTAAYTFSAWFKTSGSSQGLVTTWNSSNSGSAELYQDVNGKMRMYAYGATSANRLSINAVNNNIWHYAVGTYDGTSLNMYIDGALSNGTLNGTIPASITAATQVYNGAEDNAGSPGAYFSGSLDELRMSNTARSAGWIATEYNNQSSPSTFYSLGGQEKNIGTPPGLKFR